METYLTFILGNELFAVPVTNVLEVLQKQQITHVPNTPDHILGIINFRGDILPVVDTRLKFSLPASEVKHSQIVIVFELSKETEMRVIAATADGVKDVIDIDQKDIKPVPEMGLCYDERYIKGAVYRNNAFIMILDVEKVFSLADLAILNNFENTNSEITA